MIRMHWFARLRSSAPVRPPAGRLPSRRHRYRPRVESLEGRCLPSTVTNLNDTGPGSFRQAIHDTVNGTLDFAPGLTGTITVSSETVAIAHPLTIQGPGAKLITISGGGNPGSVFSPA